MKITTKLTPSKIVDKEFSPKKHGYDALEVDKFLDEIVQNPQNVVTYYVTKNETSSVPVWGAGEAGL